MTQLALHFPEERRIDVTLGRIDEVVLGLTDEERAALPRQRWWGILVTVSRLRSMEMAEESVLGHSKGASLANAYDRIVQPGGHAVQAILDTFVAVYGAKQERAA